jgi:hypothetical protein
VYYVAPPTEAPIYLPPPTAAPIYVAPVTAAPVRVVATPVVSVAAAAPRAVACGTDTQATCAAWASQGLCTSASTQSWMAVNCAKSCTAGCSTPVYLPPPTAAPVRVTAIQVMSVSTAAPRVPTAAPIFVAPATAAPVLKSCRAGDCGTRGQSESR